MTQITNRDIYDAINDFRREVNESFEKRDVKIDANTSWRHQITGKLTILFIFIGAGINLLLDWIQRKFNV